MTDTSGQGSLFPSGRGRSDDRAARPPKLPNLAEALIEKLTGRKAGFADRLARRSIDKQATWLEKQHKGDAKAAAAAAGVSVTTWRRWKSGKQQPSAKAMEGMQRAQRAAMVPQGRRDRIAKSTGGPSENTMRRRLMGRSRLQRTPEAIGAKIAAWVQVSSDQRPRELNFGPHLEEGRLLAVVTAYIEEGEEAALLELRAAIAEYLGTDDFEITNVTGLDFPAT